MKTLKKCALVAILFAGTGPAMADSASAANSDAALYAVCSVVLVIWAAVSFLLIRVDLRLKRIEKSLGLKVSDKK
jgi:hypothetical protein